MPNYCAARTLGLMERVADGKVRRTLIEVGIRGDPQVDWLG
jgi:hypothetical protein